jgi:DNA replication protein DnaC
VISPVSAARLRTSASIEDLDFHPPRGLDSSFVLSLAEGGWVTAHRNVLVTGPTGVGKTFVACALAQAALRRDHRALYLRVPRLLDELLLARADGRLPRLMAAWARLDLLILDDLGLQPLTPPECGLFASRIGARQARSLEPILVAIEEPLVAVAMITDSP